MPLISLSDPPQRKYPPPIIDDSVCPGYRGPVERPLKRVRKPRERRFYWSYQFNESYPNGGGGGGLKKATLHHSYDSSRSYEYVSDDGLW
jgi:hypothetical protein